MPSDERLDAFDRKILAILQADNLTAQRDIGEAVHLSAAAVHRRIHRLFNEGIILANAAVVAPERIGRAITVVVEVSVESERQEELEALKQIFFAAPEVQQCYYVTGEFDFVLIITVVDMKEYEELTKRLFFANPNIKRFRTAVTMDRVKATLTVPV